VAADSMLEGSRARLHRGSVSLRTHPDRVPAAARGNGYACAGSGSHPVTVQDVPITKEWVGTLDGRVNAQIRAQVSGYLMKQDYTEGSFRPHRPVAVRNRPAPLPGRAEPGQRQSGAGRRQPAAGTRPTWGRTKPGSAKANLDVQRYTPLAKTRAISQEELDNAVQSQLEASAAVQIHRGGH